MSTFLISEFESMLPQWCKGFPQFVNEEIGSSKNALLIPSNSMLQNSFIKSLQAIPFEKQITLNEIEGDFNLPVVSNGIRAIIKSYDKVLE